MSKARLIQGEDYVINGVYFRNGIDVSIDDELKSILEGNEQFEIIEEEKPQEVKPQSKDSKNQDASKGATS